MDFDLGVVEIGVIDTLHNRPTCNPTLSHARRRPSPSPARLRASSPCPAAAPARARCNGGGVDAVVALPVSARAAADPARGLRRSGVPNKWLMC